VTSNFLFHWKILGRPTVIRIRILSHGRLSITRQSLCLDNHHLDLKSCRQTSEHNDVESVHYPLHISTNNEQILNPRQSYKCSKSLALPQKFQNTSKLSNFPFEIFKQTPTCQHHKAQIQQSRVSLERMLNISRVRQL
jgi:hypothetical protein